MLASNGNKTWPRRMHAVVGIISSVNLMALLVSGLLLQHRETFGLDERVISRTVLPNSYRSADGPDGVRADIVAADLHSGRLFGRAGLLVLDVVTIFWAILLLSGIFIFTSKQLRSRTPRPVAAVREAQAPQRAAPSYDGRRTGTETSAVREAQAR